MRVWVCGDVGGRRIRRLACHMSRRKLYLTIIHTFYGRQLLKLLEKYTQLRKQCDVECVEPSTLE